MIKTTPAWEIHTRRCKSERVTTRPIRHLKLLKVALAVTCLLAISGGITGASAQTHAPSVVDLKAAAQAGDADAQFTYSQRLQDGNGVLQNYRQAAEWALLAAQAGHVGAQNQLGKYYHAGLGVPRDQSIAIEWLEKAATTANPQFMFDLATVLETATDGGSDVVRAAELYDQAAQAGHRDAAVSLGLMYQQGIGVTQDFLRAADLYAEPAQSGHPRAQNNLGLLYVRGNGVAQDYERAAKLFTAAAEAGFPAAMGNLGTMYFHGLGVAQSDEMSVDLQRRAAMGPQETAELALVYDARLAPPATTMENPQQTLTAAQAGDPVAEFLMGWGLANQGDTINAMQWFKAAALKGHAPSMANLATYYTLGNGAPQDYVLAYMWRSLAASAGLTGQHRHNIVLGNKMTAAQINDAQSKAELHWRRIKKRQ
jgi:TPR repeat protein